MPMREILRRLCRHHLQRSGTKIQNQQLLACRFSIPSTIAGPPRGARPSRLRLRSAPTPRISPQTGHARRARASQLRTELL